MAKQTGPNPFTGRRGNLLGYRMAGKYYVRIVSNLTAKRVRKDPAFKLTMEYAGLLGKASKIASGIYRLLPDRKHGFYRRLTGIAMQLLKQGRTGEEAFEQLYNDFVLPQVSVETSHQDRVPNPVLPETTLQIRDEFPKERSVSKGQLILPPAEAPPKNRVSNPLLPDTTLHTYAEFPKRRGITNGQPKLVFRHEPVAVPGWKRNSSSSFPEELLRMLFLNPPEEEETEEASFADHSVP
jgi:hypothetical protein